ncbi:alpha-1-antitrypsin-like [Dendrobates tinctorius]|uniref:alpha-1-antitrypsin-like n=1 Tax=Dendrobates tinctorius TaxID=92724 RepID=UPI003CC9DADE
MKLFVFLCFSQALICALVYGHHGGPHDDDHDHDGHQYNNEPEALLHISSANLKFSYKLYHQLAAAHPYDNFFFSPLSISIAFSLLSLGAKSKTLSQIDEGFGFNKSSVAEEMIHKGFQKLLNIINQPKRGLQLDSANALFIDTKINVLSKFLDDAKKFYRSEAISTDFHKVQEALEQINSYVEKKTNGKIKDLLDNLDPMTALVIVNTIFFKGSWEHAFNINHTREEDFDVDETTVVKVPMMSRRGEYLTGYIPEIGCRVVEVPYKGNTSAIFVLPEMGKLHDAEKALQNLPEEAWNKAMKSREIILSIPKFSISGELDLVKELEVFGITEVFSDHADLSGITGDSRLKVSKAVHKAVLKVDEEGTEAAAATAIGITKLSLPPLVAFRRPFFFSIYNKDISTDIFTGRIINPTK